MTHSENSNPSNLLNQSKNLKRKNVAWYWDSKYGTIDENNSFWTCKICFDENRLKPHLCKNGTTIERHLQRIHNIYEGKRRKISDHESVINKELLNQYAAILCTDAGLPFQIHENPTFRKYCSMISMYERQNSMKFNYICRQTASTYTIKVGDKIDKEIINQLKSIKKLNLTLDCWTSKTLNHYLGVTCHYLDEDWKLRSLTLKPYPIKHKYNILDTYNENNIYLEFTKSFGLKTTHEQLNDDICLELAQSRIELLRVENTIADLLKQLPDMLRYYGLNLGKENGEVVDKIFSITGDYGTNLGNNLNINNLKDKFSWCICHLLNRCFVDTFENYAFSNISVFRKLKEISSYFRKNIKSSGLLTQNILTFSETRWCHILLVIKRFLEIYNDVNQILNTPDTSEIYKQYILHDQDILILKEIYNSFKHITSRMNILESESYPSISEVIPTLEGMKKKLENKKSIVKNDCVKKMIDLFIEGIKMRKPSYSYKEMISMYLNPNFKKLSALNLDKKSIKEFKRKIADEFVSVEINSRQILNSPINSQSSNSSEDVIEQYMDKNQYPILINEEIGRYDSIEYIFNVNPLDWWKNNENLFPHLAALAKIYLSIQASSAAIERRWSSTEVIDNKKRGNLSNDTFQDQILIGNNMKIREKLNL